LWWGKRGKKVQGSLDKEKKGGSKLVLVQKKKVGCPTTRYGQRETTPTPVS